MKISLLKGLLALLALLAVGYLIWDFTAASSLRGELATIRAAGEPLTFEDLDNARPPIDPGQDAAPLYKEALEVVAGLDGEAISNVLQAYHEALERGETPGTDSRERAARLLEDGRPALDLVGRAAALPECRYDAGVRQGFDVLYETLERGRVLMGLVSLQSRHLAVEAQADAAVASVVATLMLGRVTRGDPTLLAVLFAANFTSVAAKDTATLLSLANPSADSLQTLEKKLRDPDTAADLREMLLAERVFGIVMTRAVIGDDMGVRWAPDGPDSVADWPRSLRPRAFHRGLLTGYLRDFRGWLEATEGPWHATRISLLESQAKSVMGKQVQSALAHGIDRLAEALALLRAARTATLVEQHRAAKGRLPASLDELVPEYATALPGDPFVAAPLRYVIEENRYIVYSVGGNGKDDGGSFELNKVDDEGQDVGAMMRNIAPLRLDIGLRVQ